MFATHGILAVGTCLAGYGVYKHVRENKAGQSAQQGKVGLTYLAAGVVAIVVGFGLERFKVTTPSTIIQKTTQCSIKSLKELLESKGEDSMVYKTFKVLEDTRGISCNDFLPWKDEFHFGASGYIDGIQAAHLEKPVMWGIDPEKRPYLAIKFVCDKIEEGVATLFQRYVREGEMALGGHFQPKDCYLGPAGSSLLNPSPDQNNFYLSTLKMLFEGDSVPIGLKENAPTKDKKDLLYIELSK